MSEQNGQLSWNATTASITLNWRTRDLSEVLESCRPYLNRKANQFYDSRISGRISWSDIVQETIWEAYQCFRSFKGTTTAEFLGWLKTILRNNARNALRDQRALKRTVDRESRLDSDRFRQLATDLRKARNQDSDCQNLCEKFRLLIQKLPADQRTAIWFRYAHGKSIAEISTYMRKSDSAVSGLVKRGLQNLRKQA